jgi:hypothetical protein
MPSASQFYTPGPSRLFCGTGTSAAYEYLGLSRAEVRVDLTATFSDVEADFAGSEAADSQLMAEAGYVSFDLSYYREDILLKLMKRAVASGNTAGAMSAPSANGQGIGTLMQSEGVAVPFCVQCPNVAKAAYSATMIPCFTFGVCWLDGTLSTPLGTKVKYPRVVIRAMRAWNPLVGSGVLYTNTIPGSLPALT